MKKLWLIPLMFGCALLAYSQARYSAAGKVVNSRHDLSITSTGSSYKAVSQNQVCIFCHTPHNARPAAPLWNHTLSTGFNYGLYTSSTLKATMSQPTSSDNTKLCLSCHDGTVALGDTVNNGSIPMQNSVTVLPANAGNTYTPPRSTNLGTSLADDHPTAFTPVSPILPAYPQVQPPPTGDAVQLEGGMLQCTSCHNPHEEFVDVTEGRFLRKANRGGAICTSCHKLQSASAAVNHWSWDASSGQQTSHATATNPYTASTNAGGVTWLGSHTGYSTTADNGCQSCHRSHTAHDAQRLMKGDTDVVCFQCHDGNTTTNLLFPAPLQTTRQNMVSAFAKTYAHPGTGTSQSGHDPNELPLINASRHSACDDCHNGHAAKANPATAAAPLVPPMLSPTLYGVSGVPSADGAATEDPRRNGGEAQFEYEICYKCHADSTGKPQVSDPSSYLTYGYTPLRVTYTPNPAGSTSPNAYNVRLEMNSTVSRHPVAHPRSSAVLQSSLLASVLNLNGTNSSRTLGAGSQIFCTDCHNNDQDRQFLGTGPNGNHGSLYPHILERNYQVNARPSAPGSSITPITGNLTSITGPFAMCAKCHSISTLIQDQTFAHNTHVNDRGFSCSICHSAHGIQNDGIGLHQGLVDFDPKFVAPNTATGFTVPVMLKTAGGRIYCNLICHNETHDQNNPN